MHNKPELLAPAGRWDVLEAVISAGADAVYLGSKKFNMRLHRSDYHFTDEQLVRAVNLAHEKCVKIYVTVNNLLSDSEIGELRLFLEFMQDIGADAIIVQDLGVIHLAREMGLRVDLHSSTMMNAHSVAMAQEIKSLGVSRIITSRDISLAQAKEIHEKCDIEVEYFVHGDMCSAQGSQCYSSGVMFGKSSNRGECMKPCRWKYGLVDMETDEHLCDVDEGHFLAMNDICLLQHIPSLVQAGICSFKIEGRMRDAAFLGEIVSTYRRAIDLYMESPAFYYPDVEEIEKVYRSRVRNLSTSVSLALAQPGTFDFSGKREPLFLSRYAREKSITKDDLQVNPFVGYEALREDCAEWDEACGLGGTRGCGELQSPELVEDAAGKASSSGYSISANDHSSSSAVALGDASCACCEDIPDETEDSYGMDDFMVENQRNHRMDKLLSVKVGSFNALKNAVSEGADSVYINGDISPKRGQRWTLDMIRDAAGLVHDSGRRIGLCTPRITGEREMGDVKRLLDAVKGFGIDSILVHNPGTLRAAREFAFNIITDFSFNVLNTYSASLLRQIGADMVTMSVEASFGDVCRIAQEVDVDVECVVHGQLPFMVLEHCLPAIIVTKSNASGFCRQPCRHINYALRDECGEVRPIEVDQYCRNHILFASDLCVLPYIGTFMDTAIGVFRIEAQYYDDDLVGAVVRLYRKQMDAINYNSCGDSRLSDEDWNELVAKSPRKLNLGAYKHSIFHSRKTVDVIRALH